MMTNIKDNAINHNVIYVYFKRKPDVKIPETNVSSNTCHVI